jgi:hypothetical protein
MRVNEGYGYGYG